MTLRVSAVERETPAISAFELVDPEGRELPAFTAGAHLDLFLPSGLVRQYSLCNPPQERDRYRIAVLLENDGRGGSREMHERVSEGALLEVTAPRNNFPLSNAARSHLLIAGGIGITPMLAMVWELARRGADWRLHYCTRSPEDTAFYELLAAPRFAEHMAFHHDGGDPSKGLDVASLLAGVREGTHVYCCGPAGLMAAARAAGAHLLPGRLHFEHFSVDQSVAAGAADGAFEVEIASSGQVIEIPADRSILETLEDHGIEVEHMCTEGLCGTCIVDVLEGIPDHRDVVLDDEEKASNKLMTVCCSRAKSGRLKLDL
jgi:vanillate O-demethylase ferredoxin subunit